jgi:hypothetical protein
MRRFLRLSAIILLCILSPHPSRTSHAQNLKSKESLLQAAYLYNFAFFMDWPATAFTGRNDPLVIGIAGRNSLINTVSDAVKEKMVHGRRLEVIRVNSVADAKRTHILFIGFSETEKIESYLSELRHDPVVTVSDEEEFNERGGMIRFFTDDNQLSLRN